MNPTLLTLIIQARELGLSPEETEQVILDWFRQRFQVAYLTCEEAEGIRALEHLARATGVEWKAGGNRVGGGNGRSTDNRVRADSHSLNDDDDGGNAA